MSEYAIFKSWKKTVGVTAAPSTGVGVPCAYVLVVPAIKAGPASSNTDVVFAGAAALQGLCVNPDNMEGVKVPCTDANDVYLKAASGTQVAWLTAFGRVR